jgi:hypothetical protein|uniref:Uncharacterized protein n=2 Tax=Zea mays TaxID=4577 RepID=A0A804RBT4_MAIZE
MADTLALPTRPPPPPPPPMDPERFDGSRSDPQPVPVPVRAHRHSTQVAAGCGWLEKIHPQERAELAEEEKARQQLQTPTKFAALGANSRSWPQRKAERGLQLHCTRLLFLLLRSPAPSHAASSHITSQPVRPSVANGHARQPANSITRAVVCVHTHSSTTVAHTPHPQAT